MSDSRIEQFDKAVKMRKESTDAFGDYWLDYSLYTTFEFWLLIIMFIVPLIIIMIKIDKQKAFEVGFFGYGVHVFSHYIDLLGVNVGIWNYPISLIPSIPSVSFDACVIPVTYMLVYQWTLNKKKNYYIFISLTAVILVFAFEPILAKMGLFRMYGQNIIVYRFLMYITVALIAKTITNIFIKLYGNVLRN